jgi:hypothetical protein
MFLKKEIDTLVLPTGKYYLIVFCVILISLLVAAFFIFLGLKYHMLWVILVGPLVSIAVPGIFFTLKINLIAKKATIYFSEEFIEIKNSGLLNDKFNYSDIKYFSASAIDVDKCSKVKFILRNKVKKRYIFFRQLDNDENVLNTLLLYFSSYNSAKMQEKEIQISPSFFLTKPGKVFVVVTGFIILVAIIIQVIYKPKATPASLIAVLGGYLQAKGIQMNDRKILDKFREQNGD